MERYFKIPSVEFMVEFIYSGVVHSHEYGERQYKYKIPYGLSTEFINEIVDMLAERLLDVDVIELNNGYIFIDWS